jgi:hypothetical protein
MKNTRLVNTVLILLLFLNAAFVGSWWYGHWKAHRMQEHKNRSHFSIDTQGAQCMVKELNLSDSQQTKLQAMRKEHFQKMSALELVVARNEKNLLHAIMANPLDSIHASQSADSIGIAKASMQKELFRHLADIKKLCNSDQSRKFDELINKMSDELPHHWDIHHGPNNGVKRDSM